jgi:hypothetical protein
MLSFGSESGRGFGSVFHHHIQTRTRIISGLFFLPEIPAPRGGLAFRAAGGHLRKHPGFSVSGSKSVSILCLACGWAQFFINTTQYLID